MRYAQCRVGQLVLLLLLLVATAHLSLMIDAQITFGDDDGLPGKNLCRTMTSPPPPPLPAPASRSYRCQINILSYSAYTPACHVPNNGHVIVEGRKVWDAGWCRLNLRGINTMIVDPADCSVHDQRRFDTWELASAADDLVDYIDYLRPGALLVGVTGDEPTRYLSGALRRLKAAGVRVDDVQSRGSFAFVIQIGYPEKTAMAKSINNSQLNVQLAVTVTGTTVDDLKVTKV